MTDPTQLILGELASGSRTHSALTMAGIRKGIDKPVLLAALNDLLEREQIVQRVKSGGCTYALSDGVTPPPAPPSRETDLLGDRDDDEDLEEDDEDDQLLEDDDAISPPQEDEDEDEPADVAEPCPEPAAAAAAAAEQGDGADEWVSTKEAAELLGVSVNGIYSAVRRGALESRSGPRPKGAGGRAPLEFRRSSVEAYSAAASRASNESGKQEERPASPSVMRAEAPSPPSSDGSAAESAPCTFLDLERGDKTRNVSSASYAAANVGSFIREPITIESHERRVLWALRRLLKAWRSGPYVDHSARLHVIEALVEEDRA